MTEQQLCIMRDDVAYRMIEASPTESKQLEQELYWIEELIKEQESINGKENDKDDI